MDCRGCETICQREINLTPPHSAGCNSPPEGLPMSKMLEFEETRRWEDSKKRTQLSTGVTMKWITAEEGLKKFNDGNK